VGELDHAQVRRLMAFGDRLHYPWRQEPKAQQSPNRSAIANPEVVSRGPLGV
jgi:hypothetical protein